MLDNPFIAVFFVGLLGGVHCAGMCGGLVSALSLRGGRQPASRPLVFAHAGKPASVIAASIPGGSWSVLSTQLAYNAGRISTYLLLGVVAGWIGSFAWLLEHWLPVQRVAFGLTQIVLIVLGLYLIGIRWVVTNVERLGQPLWRHLQPLATRALQRRGLLASLLAGGVWGMVPCGMVYAVLMTAVVSADPLRGGLLMLAFGLGTLPNLLAMGYAGQWLARALRRPWWRRSAGALIIVFGVLGLIRLPMMSAHANHIEHSTTSTTYPTWNPARVRQT